ncbi:MAG: osmotically-inducible protein OsmY [Cycloclasticus sp.]|jgi:osmotically-inducible protein OsmY
MKFILCSLIFSTSTAGAFEFSDISERIFGDNVSGVEGQIKDAEFEFEVGSAILLDETLRKNSHILVSRNRNSVLIAGQANSQELKDQVLRVVLDAAHLKWTQGDVNHVEPSNAQVCGEKASKMAANDRRRFNLKTAEECTTVNRFYNEVRVSTPISEIARSDDDVLRATITNKLLHAAIIDRADSIKVLVSDQYVYLLGDQLDQATAQKAAAFVQAMNNAKKVVPLFRF